MAEIQAYDSLEPFGNIEPTYMAASLTGILLNSIRSIFAGKGEKPQLVPIEDFIPRWGRTMTAKKEQTVADLKTVLQSLTTTTTPKTKKRKVRR